MGTALAGDRYLICETVDAEESQSSLLVAGCGAVILEREENSEAIRYVVTVTEDRPYNEYDITRVNLSNGGFLREAVRTSEDTQPVRVAPHTDCWITD